MAIELVFFPFTRMVGLSSSQTVNVYQRVNLHFPMFFPGNVPMIFQFASCQPFPKDTILHSPKDQLLGWFLGVQDQKPACHPWNHWPWPSISYGKKRCAPTGKLDLKTQQFFKSSGKRWQFANWRIIILKRYNQLSFGPFSIGMLGCQRVVLS